MKLSEHYSFRALALLCCSMGMVGIADGTPAMWTLVTLATLLSAMLLAALINGPSVVPATAKLHVEVTR